MYLHKDSDAFAEIVQATADDMGIPEEYMDKDYFVSLLLKNIARESPNVIFKGGTSLSKCYGVINRFSEDIDITLNLNSNATNREKEHEKRELITAINRAIKRLDMHLINPEKILSRRDFNRYEVEYSAIFGTGEILRSHLLIESYLTLKSFPFERRQVNNYILEYLKKEGQFDLIKQYELDPFEINVQSIERTFIDKIFAICDYHELGLYTQNSRHFYDLHRIWENSTFVDEELVILFYEVAHERRKVEKRNISSRSGYLLKSVLSDILEKDYFKEDYNSNTLYLLFEQVDYKTVKKSLLEILDRGIFPDVVE
ncbi:nucleotidyl transferase AbiEii/AbiGii toxin family protein [Bacillus niameyensis]|uniref:nucleotidyl transferase AbiEii/AbiGii toxin family protein n=1 Tax=Bacillus niameyensis TaxID=1522308 RepID=UPI000780951D|nr:nucleotidyl transferase AbiEii/AbiGii toxin family protein [Bacillus niameyensis]